MNTDHWITAVLALRKARSVVVFSGAGISAESGIPTFRDADGFWQRFPPEKFATWSGLLQTALTSPRAVAEFVLNVVEPIARAEPNAGHRAVADLESRVKTTVVTQNIDGLHQSAGSTNVFEVHGSLLEVVDVSSGRTVHRFQRAELASIAAALHAYATKQSSVATLGNTLRKLYPWDWRGRHRPRLVLFGDSLAEPDWTRACQAAETCDVFLSVGTSGAVFPAAMLPSRAALSGATVIAVDPQACDGCWLEGNAGSVLPSLLKDAFEGKIAPGLLDFMPGVHIDARDEQYRLLRSQFGPAFEIFSRGRLLVELNRAADQLQPIDERMFREANQIHRWAFRFI